MTVSDYLAIPLVVTAINMLLKEILDFGFNRCLKHPLSPTPNEFVK